jgi:hypothetical protein
VNTALTKCWTESSSSVMWVLYPRKANEFSIAKFEFENGIIEGNWKYWHPITLPEINLCISLIDALSGGLAVNGN